MNIHKPKVGDTVICDLDGKVYQVDRISSRDEVDPIQGVVQLGNMIFLRSPSTGKLNQCYEWEVTLIVHKLGDAE